jgi:molybdopterin molybdotransferase
MRWTEKDEMKDSTKDSTKGPMKAPKSSTRRPRKGAANDLLGFDEALALVLAAAPRPKRETVRLAEAQGRVLAGDVRADRDLPPFDRSMLDGYAVRVTGDFGGMQVLPVAGEVAAGERPPKLLAPDTCVRIWTGAAVPSGAQGVIPVERAREVEGRAYLEGPLSAGTDRRPGIAERGEDARRGTVVLSRGRRVTPAAASLLASVGLADVPVYAQPEVAIVVTGHEIVPPASRPSAVQVRSANDATVAAIAEASGVSGVSQLGIVEDDPAPLRRTLRRGLGHDILVVTGGVSAGRLDLVPDILKELGVKIILHRVAIRPGKPFLFGVDTKGGRRTAVFGLPGNPVSVLATAVEFLTPFLRAWRAEASRPLRAKLDAPVRRPPGLLHFVPCDLWLDAEGSLRARGIESHGSGDFVSVSCARAFLRVPGGVEAVPAGTMMDVDPIPGCTPTTEEP